MALFFPFARKLAYKFHHPSLGLLRNDPYGKLSLSVVGKTLALQRISPFGPFLGDMGYVPFL
jgi:hypothetical protein